MKQSLKFKLLMAFFAFGFFNAKAQTIKIDTTQISFENKLRPALGANVDPEPKPLKKAWAAYLKKKYDVKIKGIGWFANKDLLTAQDVTIATISTKRMNLYTRIIETTSGSEIKLFASFGYDIFIGSSNYPIEFSALQNMLNTFLLQNLNEYYSDEEKATSKRIKSLNKEKISLLKSIEKNQSRIKRAESDIEQARAKQDSTAQSKINATEKITKLTTEKTNMENENLTSAASIQLIDEKLTMRKAKLEKLKLKHKELINDKK